jgi:hypothetical protein
VRGSNGAAKRAATLPQLLDNLRQLVHSTMTRTRCGGFVMDRNAWWAVKLSRATADELITAIARSYAVNISLISWI